MIKYLLLFIFLPTLTFAQAKEGSVTYEMFFDFNNWKTNGELDYEIRKVKKDAEQATFTLLYNAEGMIFTDNRLDEAINEAIFGLMPGFRYYYKKATDDAIYSVEKIKSGENKISKLHYFTDWKLTQELKKINGFVCYKATRMPDQDSDEEIDKSFPIIAWYTKEIPLPYGPFAYGGLPGLILELQREGNVFFKVKTMRWNDNNKIEIKFPD